MTSITRLIDRTTNPQFLLTQKFGGYRNKTDITNIPEEISDKAGNPVMTGYLVAGSQNVLSNDAERIQVRGGYTLDGAAADPNVISDPIVSSFDHVTNNGFEHHLRIHQGIIEFRYEDASGNITWNQLMTVATNATWDGSTLGFKFTTYWDTSEGDVNTPGIEEALFVNGDSHVYQWGLGLATFGAAMNSNIAITKKSFASTTISVVPTYNSSGLTNVASFSGSTTTSGNAVVAGTLGGFILMPVNPSDGDTMTLTINGTSITITFVTGGTSPSTLTTGAGNVLVGASAAATVANLIGLLNHPNLSTPNWNALASAYWTYLDLMDFNGWYDIEGTFTTAGDSVNGSLAINGANAYYAQTGSAVIIMPTNPSNGDTLTLTYNTVSIQIQFVSSIGAVAGNVLIGAAASNTATNLLGLLTAPGTTNSTQVALSANNQKIVATLSYASTTGIICQGTKTWKELGFMQATSGRGIVLEGKVYTYTGGETTQCLTGVSPDPTLITHTVGHPIVQSVLAIANSSLTSIPSTFAQDLIGNCNNQIYYGSTKSSQVYISKLNNFKDASYTSTPGGRVPGEGGLLYLDANCVGFAVGESPSKNQNQLDIMFIDAGRDFTYQVIFSLAANLANESVVIRRLQTSARSAALSQDAIAKIKNAIVKISQEPTLDSYANLEKIITPKSLPISDSVKNDFLAYDFTNVHVLFYQSNIYIAVPKQGLVLVYNLAKGFWEAPQVLPVRRLAIINGLLYGHSSQTYETYKLFDGTNDNGNAINAIAAFSYQTYGPRYTLKNFHEIYTEGYISPNTKLTLSVLFEYGGSKLVWSDIIDGSDLSLRFEPTIDPSLGKNELGSQGIGTVSVPVGTLNKFRKIKKVVKQNFFESQIAYQSNDIDQTWELIAFGPAVIPSGADPVQIKK